MPRRPQKQSKNESRKPSNRVFRNSLRSASATIPGSEEEMRFAVLLRELARDGGAARQVAREVAEEMLRTAVELTAESTQLRSQAARLRRQAQKLLIAVEERKEERKQIAPRPRRGAREADRVRPRT